MRKGLKAEKWQIKQLTFNRHKTVDVLIDRICHHLTTHGVEVDKEALTILRQWLLVPYSMWDIDLKGMGQEVCYQIETIKKIDDELLAIVNNLRKLPGRKAQEVVAQVEKRMFAGDYDFCHTQHARNKFALYEIEQLDDPEWHTAWKEFTDRYDVTKRY
ncbi:MAG: hypothetical protein JWM68_398 [Verrucomicrobiales bacterium]|nr:hypothetical protein [Verrucomicrobiales bacterium]